LPPGVLCTYQVTGLRLADLDGDNHLGRLATIILAGVEESEAA
jgi:hypothetical protein